MSRKIFNILFLPIFLFGGNNPIQEIELEGIITNPKQEISGMDWYNDNLFLLPENLGGYLFMVTKDEIEKQLSSKKGSIQPKKIIFNTPDYSKSIPGFDGFEAITFNENSVYVSIEADQNDMMVGYIAWGNINPNSYEINILEKDIISKKNIISKENFDKEVLLFKEKANKFKEDQSKIVKDFNNFKKKELDGILSKISPIINSYMEKKSVKILLDSKNILIGRSNLNLTDEVIKEINEKIK